MRVIVMLAISLLIVLSSCNSAEEKTSDENVSTKQNQDKVGQEPKQSNEEKTDVSPDVEEKNGEDQKELAERQKSLYRVSENWSLVPIEEGTNEKVVLLTIDDAPEKYSLEMAKTLKELDAGAIFFVNGHFIDTPEEQEMLKEIHEMGFVIGNHTYSHVNLGAIENNPDKQREEIIKLNDLIEDIIGERPKFFRAPHGVNTELSKQIAIEEQMVLMNWSYGYDYFTPYMDKEKLTEAMVSGKGPEVDVPYSLLKPGANLLMHDREWTNAALKDIVLGLREQGYEVLDPHEIKTIE
ncbi:polysaccharide deacetylase family protein [Ornithinibacillus scapharcae]|uniref:polysaccharide deacetylase family protein n=1 Tax=Ornithinibacillus scapharcae TaxID=1147159 RepID=UPI000225BA8B|nr:polysaccharide deacetylase family protein [Ornithinibacillus scapharcae]